MKHIVFCSFLLSFIISSCTSRDKEATEAVSGTPPAKALIAHAEENASKETQMLSAPSTESIIQALKETGIQIYNINLPKINLENYELILYKDTYLKGVKTKNASYPTYAGLKPSSYTNGQNRYNVVLTLIDKNDSMLKESWQLPNGNRKEVTYKKDKQHFIDYNVTPFKSQQIVPGKKIPILMYGSAWKDEKTGYLRYCMDRELKPDFSNDAFEKMPGYFIYSIELSAIK